jgi:hypothetical protein
MISLKEFGRKYLEIEKSLYDTPKQANRKSQSNTDDIIHIVEESNFIDDNRTFCPEDGNNNKTDEFRIHRYRMIDQPSMSISTTTNLRQMLEEVAIIFPSVFYTILGITERNPHLIIRPSYFDTVSDEEQFPIFSTHTLDGKYSFLSFSDAMTKGNNSLSWLRRISFNNDVDSSKSVSLSALLFARFEWAAWESFLEFEYNETTSTNEKNNVLDPKNHLLSVLGDILSHCRAMSDRSLTIDSSTLESFFVPITKTFFSSGYGGLDCDTLDQVQNIILTPISWVWFVSQRKALTDFSFGVLDKAIETSLERMEDNKDMSCSIDIKMVSSTDNMNNTLEQSPQRKKKKKNKKKKVC